MLGNVNYLRLKNILLKYYKNSNVYIETVGVINTRYCIEKAKINLNKRKLIILNENLDCTILLDFIKKYKQKDIYHIEFYYDDSKVVLEI